MPRSRLLTDEEGSVQGAVIPAAAAVCSPSSDSPSGAEAPANPVPTPQVTKPKPREAAKRPQSHRAGGGDQVGCALSVCRASQQGTGLRVSTTVPLGHRKPWKESGAFLPTPCSGRCVAWGAPLPGALRACRQDSRSLRLRTVQAWASQRGFGQMAGPDIFARRSFIEKIVP